MGYAVIIYLIGLYLFIGAGISSYLSDIEYKLTGHRRNRNIAIRGLLSFFCFWLGTFIMMHL